MAGEGGSPLIPMGALMALMKRMGSSFSTSESSEGSKRSQSIEEAIAYSEDTLKSKKEDVTFRGKYAQLQATVAHHIISECIDHVTILGMIGGLPPAKQNIQYKTLEERYGENVQQSYLFDPETLEPYEAAIKTQMLIKFQKDRSYIEQVLKEANDEIKRRGNIQTFLTRLDEFTKSEEERDALLEEIEENQSRVKKLSSLLQTEKVRLTKQLDEKTEELGEVKDEYEDIIYENEIKSVYINRWENARTVQNNLQLQQKEEYYTNIIDDYENKTRLENQVNSDVEQYLMETQHEHVDDIELWMERYDKDVEMKDMEIQFLKEKQLLQSERLQKLLKMYEEHKKEIEDYLVLKEKRRLADLELARLSKAATKIQAWWRGTMYRKHLGPYRKKKGKDKGKGKNKGKKK